MNISQKKESDLIVVLCDSWEDACYMYDYFVQFVATYNPGEIKEYWCASNCVRLWCGLRYIFIDARCLSAFEGCTLDIVDCWSFCDCMYQVEQAIEEDYE